MKDILKVLGEQKKEAASQYEKLTQQRQRTQAQLGNIATEMARLEGEHRKLEQLEKEFEVESE